MARPRRSCFLPGVARRGQAETVRAIRLRLAALTEAARSRLGVARREGPTTDMRRDLSRQGARVGAGIQRAIRLCVTRRLLDAASPSALLGGFHVVASLAQRDA